MKCSKCGYESREVLPLIKRVARVLGYMIKQDLPLFGAPLERGENHDDDDEMVFMLQNKLIEQIGTKGFIATKKGKDYIKGTIYD